MGGILAGLLVGLGTGLKENAQQMRAERMKELDAQYAAQREMASIEARQLESQAQRDWTSAESEKDKTFRTSEREAGQTFTAEQHSLDRELRSKEHGETMGLGYAKLAAEKESSAATREANRLAAEAKADYNSKMLEIRQQEADAKTKAAGGRQSADEHALDQLVKATEIGARETWQKTDTADEKLRKRGEAFAAAFPGVVYSVEEKIGEESKWFGPNVPITQTKYYAADEKMAKKLRFPYRDPGAETGVGNKPTGSGSLTKQANNEADRRLAAGDTRVGADGVIYEKDPQTGRWMRGTPIAPSQIGAENYTLE